MVLSGLLLCGGEELGGCIITSGCFQYCPKYQRRAVVEPGVSLVGAEPGGDDREAGFCVASYYPVGEIGVEGGEALGADGGGVLVKEHRRVAFQKPYLV